MLRLLAPTLFILMLLSGTAMAEPEWGTTYERPWGVTGGPEAWAWQQPVQGEPVRLMAANFPQGGVTLRVLDEQGDVLFEERVELREHVTANTIWRVPVDAAPGPVTLVAEGDDGSRDEAQLRVHAAPHLFVPTEAPPEPGEWVWFHAVGFDDGRVNLTVLQSGQRWSAEWTHEKPDEPGMIRRAFTADVVVVPGADAPERVLRVQERDGTPFSFPVLGGAVALWVNGTFHGEEVSLHESWTVSVRGLDEAPLVWTEPGETATVGDAVHLFAYGFHEVSEVAWNGAPVSAPDPAEGFFQLTLAAPESEGNLTLRLVGAGLDGAPLEVERALRVEPRPSIAGHADVPAPALLLAMLSIALAARLHKKL